jgi:hypothetical protein
MYGLAFLFMCLPLGAQSVSSTSEDEDALNATTRHFATVKLPIVAELTDMLPPPERHR